MKATYEEVGTAFDTIWAPFSGPNGIYTEENRQACRKQWIEYLTSAGWTEVEWDDVLMLRLGTKNDRR